jgi:hypothetical protein
VDELAQRITEYAATVDEANKRGLEFAASSGRPKGVARVAATS